MRDWARAFRRASFRGVRFWVDDESPTFGRRIAVMEVSGGEAPVTEDLGRETAEFRITAYVASDLADVEGLALEAACAAPGPSMLVLPMDAPLMARSLPCQRRREKDRNGYIAYELTFVELGGSGTAAATGVPALRTSFSTGLTDVAASLAGAF